MDIFDIAVRLDVENDEHFVQMIKAAKQDLSDGEIGNACSVSRPTASRWSNGVTSPHPFIRRSIARGLMKAVAVKRGVDLPTPVASAQEPSAVASMIAALKTM